MSVWAATDRITSEDVAVPMAPQASDLVGRYERGRRRRVRVHRIRRVAQAASLVAVLSALIFGTPWHRGQLRSPEPDSFAATEFVAGPMESSTVTLGDGTVVQIAPGSRLRVMLDTLTRKVWLDGKAYFAVAPQPERPFTVHTDAGVAHVLGTRFEMAVEEEDLRVIVVEGRVALSAEEETVEVAAGEMSRAMPGSRPTVENVADIDAELEWLKGFLAFQAAPLRQVAHEIESSYGVRVLLSDRTLADRTVTATFMDQPVEDVLEVVCRVIDAQCTLQDSVVRIDP